MIPVKKHLIREAQRLTTGAFIHNTNQYLFENNLVVHIENLRAKGSCKLK